MILAVLGCLGVSETVFCGIRGVHGVYNKVAARFLAPSASGVRDETVTPPHIQGQPSGPDERENYAIALQSCYLDHAYAPQHEAGQFRPDHPN